MESVRLALTTRVGHERKVARELAVASERILGYRVDAEIVADQGKPRWPGLIIVEISDTEESSLFIRRFPGVIGPPTGPLGEEELKALTQERPDVEREVPGRVGPGDVLDVVGGPFAGMSTTVELVDGNRIRGAVVIFGRDTSVWFEQGQLRSR